MFIKLKAYLHELWHPKSNHWFNKQMLRLTGVIAIVGILTSILFSFNTGSELILLASIMFLEPTAALLKDRGHSTFLSYLLAIILMLILAFTLIIGVGIISKTA